MILLGSTIFANIFCFALKRFGKKLVAKTKTELDNILLYSLIKPLYAVLILAGLYFSLNTLSIASHYSLWINRIFFTVIVVLLASLVSRVFSILISSWLKVKKKFEQTPKLITKIVTVAVYIIALLMILSYFNVEISPLIATLGIGGLAVGLALQNTLSNLFAGLHIISDRPVGVGDFIELSSEVFGYVEDIGWRSTRIRTTPSKIIVVPNSKLAESTIINRSLPKQEMNVIVQCGVSYKSNLKGVEKITLDVAKKIQKSVEGAVRDFEPLVRFHTFGDSNILFSVVLRAEKMAGRYLITHEFIKALKERYDKERIDISWPVRKIYKGN